MGVPSSGPWSAHFGTNVLATVLNGNYPDNASSFVTSPVFLVPPADQNPRLRFWHWWSFNDQDYGQVQVSTNNGASWVALSPSYTADSMGRWTRAELDLGVYAGQVVRVGFYFYSHQTWDSWYGRWYDTVGPGWYIDEVTMVTGPLPVLVGEEGFEGVGAADRWVADFGVWEVGQPTYGPPANGMGLRAHSGTNCLATILDGDYYDNRSSLVVSPGFVVPGAGENPRLRFWHWWSFNDQDYGQVQVSTNNGASWVALSPSYTADSMGRWTRAELDLGVYAGQVVRVGFYFYSHQTWDSWYGRWYDTVGPGWYMDEVSDGNRAVTGSVRRGGVSRVRVQRDRWT